MVKIGTHSGTFHADEALAVYMLKLLPEFHNAEVVRSRDQKVLDECDIVVDVGGKYEAPKLLDHHQREFTATFDEKHTVTRMSSAGLVYKHYGKKVLSQLLKEDESSAVIETIYPVLYDSFFEAVDAYDNGVDPHTEKPKFKTHANTLRAVVSNLNPIWTEEQTPKHFDEQFEKASQLMGLALESEVRRLGKSWYPARDAVLKALELRHEYDSEGRLLVFDEYVPWGGHIFELEKEQNAKILYAIYPGGDSWRVQAVAASEGSFESRKPLPEPWRGVRDEELAKLTGIKTAVFVHAAGFMGGVRTKEDALLLAQKSLDA